MTTLDELQRQLERLLAASAEAGSRNRIAVGELRGWVREYLQDYGMDVQQFPELAHEDHQNLWMADYDLDNSAFVVVLIFRRTGIELFCGRGDSYSVRNLCEQEPSASVDRYVAAIKKRLASHGEMLVVSRELAEAWLGGSFPPTRE